MSYMTDHFLAPHEFGNLYGSQMAKLKKYIPYMPLPKNYRVGAIGLKSSNFTWILIFMFWDLGQFHEKLIFCQ